MLARGMLGRILRADLRHANAWAVGLVIDQDDDGADSRTMMRVMSCRYCRKAD